MNRTAGVARPYVLQMPVSEAGTGPPSGLGPMADDECAAGPVRMG